MRIFEHAFDFAPLEKLDTLCEALAVQGYGVLPDFLEENQAFSLFTELEQLHQEGKLHPSGVGRTAQFITEIRGDQIYWWEPTQPSLPQKDFWAILDALKTQVNRTLYLGIQYIECHYAWYPPGRFYEKHLDAFSGRTGRKLSFVYYLNPDWQASDGGQLRLYLPDKTEDILPIWNQLVCFLSE
ncbi:MAG: 2OG-Fe(II) oxygenase [Microscillaceae bacterium]